jgi:hypothetical protein
MNVSPRLLGPAGIGGERLAVEVGCNCRHARVFKQTNYADEKHRGCGEKQPSGAG